MNRKRILAALLCAAAIASVADAGGIFFGRRTFNTHRTYGHQVQNFGFHHTPTYHHTGVRYVPAQAVHHDDDQITINNYVGGQAALGDTVYGKLQVNGGYGPVDVQSLLERVLDQDAKLSAQVSANADAKYGLADLLVREHGVSSRILAAGAATAGTLTAARESSSVPQTFTLQRNADGSWSEVRSTGGGASVKAEVSIGTGHGAGSGQVQALETDLSAAVVVANRCASCHSGANPKGGVDLSDPNKFTATTWGHIFDASVTRGAMPPNGSLEPAQMAEMAKLMQVPAIAREIANLIE